MKRWWSKKYELPPNHTLLTSRTTADLMQEMLEDMVLRRDELVAALDEGGKNLDRKRALAQVDSLNEALGEPSFSEDALIDEWERQLEDGEIPDLEM